MSTRRLAFNVLVAAVDFSDTAPLVVRGAIDAAREMDAAQIHFVHVQPSPGDDRGRANECERLSDWIKTLLPGYVSPPQGTEVLVHEITGEPAHCIVELAGKLQAAGIIVGARARNFGGNTLLGSVARAVVRAAACPVLVMRPPGQSPWQSASAPAYA